MYCDDFQCKNAVYNRHFCKFCKTDNKPKKIIECYACMHQKTELEICAMCAVETCETKKEMG